jgi:hypothetical protein
MNSQPTELEVKYAELDAQLAQTTDPDDFDRLSSKLAQVQREIRLQANRERIAAEKAADAERVAKAEEFQQVMKEIGDQVNKMDKYDKAIFADLQRFFETLVKRLAEIGELEELIKRQNDLAAFLGFEPIQRTGLPKILGRIIQSNHPNEVARILFDAYFLQWGMFQDRKNSGLPLAESGPTLETFKTHGKVFFDNEGRVK